MPGIRNKVALIKPPLTAPTYIATSNTSAATGSIENVSGKVSAINIVPGCCEVLWEFRPEDEAAAERVRAARPAIEAAIVECIRRLADDLLFVYDLKPSNMVVREDPSLDIRFIDFGRDFCEWRPYSDDNEFLERAPVLSYIQTLAEQNANGRYTAKQLYADLTFALMLLMLSSNIAFSIDESRTASRQSFADNTVLNFMGSAAKSLRANTRGLHVRLLKQILRQRDIRDTLRHYIGRRNCGTKRCFHYAGFT